MLGFVVRVESSSILSCDVPRVVLEDWLHKGIKRRQEGTGTGLGFVLNMSIGFLYTPLKFCRCMPLVRGTTGSCKSLAATSYEGP